MKGHCETQVSQPKLYFLLKVATNNIKIKITQKMDVFGNKYNL